MEIKGTGPEPFRCYDEAAKIDKKAFNALRSSGAATIRVGMKRVPVFEVPNEVRRELWRKRSRMLPHQGAKECYRRTGYSGQIDLKRFGPYV